MTPSMGAARGRSMPCKCGATVSSAAGTAVPPCGRTVPCRCGAIVSGDGGRVGAGVGEADGKDVGYDVGGIGVGAGVGAAVGGVGEGVGKDEGLAVQCTAQLACSPSAFTTLLPPDMEEN